jgi:hypothetical protein
MLCKACPRCQGDLHLERDLTGGAPDLVCLQCGFRQGTSPRPGTRQRTPQLASGARNLILG